MNLLSVLNAILSLASFLAEYARDRQLIGVGESRAIARNLGEAIDAIERTQYARRAVKHDADSLRDDPDNRDRR